MADKRAIRAQYDAAEQVAGAEWLWRGTKVGVLRIGSDQFLVHRIGSVHFRVTLLRQTCYVQMECWTGSRPECGCGRESCRHVAALRKHGSEL